jgi:hypothetical protein
MRGEVRQVIALGRFISEMWFMVCYGQAQIERLAVVPGGGGYAEGAVCV